MIRRNKLFLCFLLFLVYFCINNDSVFAQGKGVLFGKRLAKGNTLYQDILDEQIVYTVRFSDLEAKEGKYNTENARGSKPLFVRGKAAVEITNYVYNFCSGPRSGVALYATNKLQTRQIKSDVEIIIRDGTAQISFLDNILVDFYWDAYTKYPYAGSWQHVIPVSLNQLLFGPQLFQLNVKFNQEGNYFLLLGNGRAKGVHETFPANMTYTISVKGYLDLKDWGDLSQEERKKRFERDGFDDLPEEELEEMAGMDETELQEYIRKKEFVIGGLDEKVMDMDMDEIKEYIKEEELKKAVGEEMY